MFHVKHFHSFTICQVTLLITSSVVILPLSVFWVWWLTRSFRWDIKFYVHLMVIFYMSIWNWIFFLFYLFFCISFSTFLLWMNPIHDIWIIFNCFTWNIFCVCHIPQGKKYGIHVPYSVFYKMFHVKHYSAQLFMATFLYTVEFSRKR